MYATYFSQSKNTMQDSTLNKKVFKVVVIAFVMLCALYVYIIGNITFNVVARKTYTQEKNHLLSRIGEIEVEYLALSGNVTMDVARASGFDNASQVFYVNKDASVTQAMLLNNEL